jgi:hypothetical protein
MLSTAAITALLGFAFGLRLKMFGLMVATTTVAFVAAGVHAFAADASVVSVLMAMVVAAVAFQLTAFVSMVIAASRSRRTEVDVADEKPEPATLRRAASR